MAWRIPSARCRRCGAEVPVAEMEAVPADWLLSDDVDGVLWPHGRADIPTGLRLCSPCRAEVRGLYEDDRRWEREAHLSADDGGLT